jgi:hypothetical protein
MSLKRRDPSSIWCRTPEYFHLKCAWLLNTCNCMHAIHFINIMNTEAVKRVHGARGSGARRLSLQYVEKSRVLISET